MTASLTLPAVKRDAEKNSPRAVRLAGSIPAVVYGQEADNQVIQVKIPEFLKVFAKAGESSLIDLALDGQKPLKVIVKDVQYDNLSSQPVHIDFYQVNMNKKMMAEVPLNFVGEARAVKELGGTLIKSKDSIEVSCLPGDLPSHIDVNLGALNEFNDLVAVKDLVLPAGVAALDGPDEALVLVSAPQAEEQPAAAEQPAAGEQPAAAEQPAAGEKKA